MKRNNGRRLSSGRISHLPHLLILAASFFLGIVLGRFASGRIAADTAAELSRYLSAYVEVEQAGSIAGLPAVFLYVRYPAAAFFLGLVSVGYLLLPLLGALYGFSLSFSVCTLAAVYGTKGLLLAAAVLGLRVLITLPCFFCLAVLSMKSSMALRQAQRGQLRRGVGKTPGLLCAGICTAILLAGAGLELLVGPWLLRTALGSLV